MRAPAVLLCLLVAACGRGEGHAPPGFLDALAGPLVGDPSPRPEDLLSSGQAVERFAVDFAHGATPSEWSFAGTEAAPRLRGEALVLRSSGEATAVWRHPVDAERITHLVVELGALPAGSAQRALRVYWQPVGAADFTAELARSASVPFGPSDGSRLVLPVSRQPSWTGTLQALAFAFPVEGPIELRAVRGLDLRPAFAAELEATGPASDAWRAVDVEVQRERRRALWTAARSELSQTVRVPSGSELHLGFALHPATAGLRSSRTRFEVGARVGGALESLAAFDVPSEAWPQLAGWHDARIDLGRFAGDELELVLATRPLGQGGEGAATAMPLLAEPRLARAERDPEAGPNLLLISVDTLRADHLESYGYPLATAPRLSELARSGVLVRHATAHAPSTLPSHGALFTGRSSLSWLPDGPHGRTLPGSFETLAELLRARGLATAAFAGGAYFDPYYGLSQGFETYSYAKTGAGGLDHSDVERNVTRAAQWLEENRDRRFFLFLHTYEVHGPFEPRAPYAERFVPRGVAPPTSPSDLESNARSLPLEAPDYPGWQDFVRAAEGPEDAPGPTLARVRATYDSEIRATDEALGRLLDALAGLGLQRDTLVVFTSDHGESFLEHGRLGHGHLYEHNLRVPLVFSFPGVLPAGLELEEAVALADVLPTTLALLGFEPPRTLAGRSLVPRLLRGEPLAPRDTVSWDDFSGLAVTLTDRRKLIAHVFARHPQAGGIELYDLGDDPAEAHDGYDALAPAEREALDARVCRILEELPGTHVELVGDEPFRFEGSLALEDAHAPLLRQLRAFPLEPGSVRFEDDQRAALRTRPARRFLAQLYRGDGHLRITGRLATADGREASVDATLELGALPRELALRAADGSLVATLRATSATPAGQEPTEAPEATGPSEETLRQLRELGYLGD